MYTGSLQVLTGNARNGKSPVPVQGTGRKKLYEI